MPTSDRMPQLSGGAADEKFPVLHIRENIVSRLMSRSFLVRPLPLVTLVRHGTHKPVPEMGKTTYVYKNLPDPGGDFEENEFSPRRLSYWPPDLGQHRPRDRRRPWDRTKELLTLYPPEEDRRPEYTDVAEYPPITDYEVGAVLSKEKKCRLQWYDKIRQLPSFSRKMYEITSLDRMPCIIVRAWSHQYNNLFHYQNMTRTNLIHGLPDLYDKMDVSQVRDVARDHILDAVALSYGESGLRKRGRLTRSDFEVMPYHLIPDVVRCEGLLMDLTNIAIKACARHAPHLIESQVDMQPEVQSYWYLREMDLPNKSLKYIVPGNFFPHSNTAVQFQDLAVVNIRSRHPLESVLSQEDEAVVTESFTPTKRNPAQDGFLFKRRRPTTHAGFWPETDDFDFPFLSIYPLHVLKFRSYMAGRDLSDTESAINAMGLMYSFAWCNSMAFYHGFSPYDELTYPFTTQTICTDGQTWNFTVYQLNTHSFHGDLLQPTKSNICWTSGPMKLFERIENGKLVGVDESVMDLFLKFMIRQPSTVNQSALRPYLSQELDMRPEEEQAKEETQLRRWFGQAKSRSEKYFVERARTLPFEWIQCERNPHAPSPIGFRRAPKYLDRLKMDKKKVTI